MEVDESVAIVGGVNPNDNEAVEVIEIIQGDKTVQLSSNIACYFNNKSFKY